MSFCQHELDPPWFVRIGLLLTVVAANLIAQTGGPDWNTIKALTRGTQVRVVVGSRVVRGEIERSTDDVLAVTSRTGQEMFDRQEISAVSIKKPSRRRKHTLIGLAAGAAGGLAIGIATRPSPGQWEFISSDAVTAGFTAAGAIVGTVVGVVIPAGGWREIYRK
jgi:hypothetical protein